MIFLCPIHSLKNLFIYTNRFHDLGAKQTFTGFAKGYTVNSETSTGERSRFSSSWSLTVCRSEVF